MSTTYKAETTLTVNGEERDVFVRGAVDVEYDRGTPWAVMDGGVEVKVDGAWLDADDVLDAHDAARAEEMLCDLAFNDDRDECVEEED